MPAQNLGFYMPDYGLNVEGQSANVAQPVGDAENVGQSQADAASEGYEQSILADLPEEAPVDCDEGEPLAEDRVVLRGPDEATVYIDGVALTFDSTFRALRAGCESLGLSKRGSKQACMKRMLDHVQTQTLLAAHSAEVRLKSEAEREVRGQKIPSVPTQVEIDNHDLTHEPFKEWCEVCTMYRARQDKHVASDHSHSGHSVLSYDSGYCSRMPGGADKLTCLVLKDRDTQLVHVVPTLQKGGKSLQHLVTEFMRFIMHTGHRELALHSDLEPSNFAILDAARKTCRGLGITVHHELNQCLLVHMSQMVQLKPHYNTSGCVQECGSSRLRTSAQVAKRSFHAATHFLLGPYFTRAGFTTGLWLQLVALSLRDTQTECTLENWPCLVSACWDF